MISSVYSICLIAVLIVLIGGILTPVSTRATLAERLTTDEIMQRIDTFIKAGLDCHNNPGLAISVVRKDSVLFAKGYGHTTTDRTEPVSNTTLFGVASLSKSFAATLILKLIEKSNGRISLKTKVSEILENDNIFHDELRSKYTTLEDLLAHRMGIPGNNQLRYDNNLTRESLTGRLKYLQPIDGFRTSFYYSNLMYGLATHIAEVIGGESWEDLVQSELFGPLGMTSSTFATVANPDEIDRAQGYVETNGDLIPVPFEFNRRWGLLCGSGCVMSSAVDMAKWMMFNMDGGKNMYGEQVLKEEYLKNAFKTQNSIPSHSTDKYYMRPTMPVSMSVTNYGLGWKLGHYSGCPMTRHSGSTYGYRALVTMLPKCKYGVFVAMTGEDPGMQFRTNIHLYIMDLLLNQEPWLNTTTVCSFPEPWQRKEVKNETELSKNLTAHRKLNDYTGVYTNKAYGTLTITINETLNLLVMDYGFGKFILYPRDVKDEFYAEGAGMLTKIRIFVSIQFENDRKSGAVTSLLANSFEIKMPPRFEKKIHCTETCSGVSLGNGYGVQFLISGTVFVFHAITNILT